MQYYIDNIPVSEHDYLAYREKKKKRNRIILIVVLVKIAVLIGVIFFVLFSTKDALSYSDAFPKAKAIAAENEQVLEITGGVEDMRISESDFETAGPFTTADFMILVDGVQKDAVVNVHMTKTLSGWKQVSIEVEEN